MRPNESKDLLLQMKSNPDLPLEFLSDNHDISALPAWVKSSPQTMDGHLAELAIGHHAILATFDGKIPGAFQIP